MGLFNLFNKKKKEPVVEQPHVLRTTAARVFPQDGTCLLGAVYTVESAIQQYETTGYVFANNYVREDLTGEDAVRFIRIWVQALERDQYKLRKQLEGNSETGLAENVASADVSENETYDALKEYTRSLADARNSGANLSETYQATQNYIYSLADKYRYEYL